MAQLHIRQIRSGEGWFLTQAGSLGPEVIASEMPDRLDGGVLLVASEAFETWTPRGGHQIEAHLYSFSGDAAVEMLRDWRRWGMRRAILAVVPAMPDDDARRRNMPDSLRPWDPDRLKATVYGQLGKDWAQSGLWFAAERDRVRYIEAAVVKALADHGARLPNGDVTIVLDLPPDATFDAEFTLAGSGAAATIRRAMPEKGTEREWTVASNEWTATERRTRRRSGREMKVRFAQGLATLGIILVSIPTFIMVAIVALIAKLTGNTTTVSSSSKATIR